MGFLLLSIAISTVIFFASSIITGWLIFTFEAYFYLLLFLDSYSAFLFSSFDINLLNYFSLWRSSSDTIYLFGDFRNYKLYK